MDVTGDSAPRRWRAALRFLTLVPMDSTLPVGMAVAFFPFPGAVIGTVAGSFVFLTSWMGRTATSALVTLLMAVAMGILREGWDPGDPRPAAIFDLRRLRYTGAGMLAAQSAVRWQVLQHSRPADAVTLLGASQLAAGAAVAALVWIARPASPAADALTSRVRSTSALVAIAMGALGVVAIAPRVAIAILGGAYLILRSIRYLWYRWRGGIDLDALGVASACIEMLALLLIVWAELPGIGPAAPGGPIRD